MKFRIIILFCLFLLVAFLLFQSRIGVPIVQAQLRSTSALNIFLPLVPRPGITATPTLTLTATATSSPTVTNTPTFTATSSPTPTPKPSLYRFGIVGTRRPFTDYDAFDIASMHFGWYVDYGVNVPASAPYGMEYMPTVRVKQLKLAADGSGSKVTCRFGDYYVTPYEYVVSPSLSQIRSVAASHPGLTWLIGNEIERRDWKDSTGACGGQDEILPSLYAQAYHDIYTAIKAADPTAKVANGSLVEFTPLRQDYLNLVWNAYSNLATQNNWPDKTMPVDVWNMHFFALREKSCSTYPNDCWGAAIPAGLSDSLGVQYSFPNSNWDFTNLWEQVLRMRTWMKNHGQKDKPLITTEYGINYPYDYFSCSSSSDKTLCPRTVRDSMMYPSFNAFLNQTDASLGDSLDGNHLVQRWAWWSLDYDDGYCDNGVFYELYGGALFSSGLGPYTPPTSCTYPAKGITYLGTYWKQYVQNLP